VRARTSERGASIIVFTVVMTFVIVPLMGLGIDVSIHYWIKAKLSSAVDAAALAAARSLNTGTTIASQTANAQLVGRQYFAANFPAGMLGTSVIDGQQVSNNVSISVSTSATNLITVTATAEVNAPLYILQLLHLSSGTITATTQTTRRSSNVVLVLDRSGSMNNASNSCAALVSSVQNFTNQFVDGRDELGMITFSTTAAVNYAPTLYFKSGTTTLNSTVSNLVCVGSTSSAQGLALAYQEIKTVINQPGALNVIVFFTDGQANQVVANYPVKTQTDTRYDYVNTSTATSQGASTCSAAVALLGLTGGYTDFSHSVNTTGYTGGVFDETQGTQINGGSGTPLVISAPGCYFTKSGYWGSYNAYQGRADVAYIPSTDVNGYATTGYKAVDTFTSGPYAGKIRPDEPSAIRYAAMNVADNVAQAIRSDTTYNIVTYTIGLSGNEPIPMDTDFLERLANDPRASNYNSAQQQGMFALATDNASLADAFNAIAAQILRISK
jgi:Mg-chelatase subunit ChlD